MNYPTTFDLGKSVLWMMIYLAKANAFPCTIYLSVLNQSLIKHSMLHNLRFKMTFFNSLYYLIEVPNTFCETSKSFQKIHATFNIWSCSSDFAWTPWYKLYMYLSLYNMNVLEMFHEKFKCNNVMAPTTSTLSIFHLCPIS